MIRGAEFRGEHLYRGGHLCGRLFGENKNAHRSVRATPVLLAALLVTEYNVGSSQILFSIRGIPPVACPFFMPTRRSDEGLWLHPTRLPLGWGWEGYCTAPGHEGVVPDQRRLQEDCSLGYASSCPRLPAGRAWDAVRFAVSGENDTQVSVTYACERSHLPAEHGNLEYRVRDAAWAVRHPDPRVQRMAECFLESWLRKNRPPVSDERSSERPDERS